LGWLLAGVFLFAAFGNLAIAMGWYFRRKRGSLIPCLGGLAGLAACFTPPFQTLRHWWWIPLVADFGTAFLIILTASFTSVITSKPAIHDHFKTGQRSCTQNMKLFYLADARWGKFGSVSF
jgi:hypothetical protein